MKRAKRQRLAVSTRKLCLTLPWGNDLARRVRICRRLSASENVAHIAFVCLVFRGLAGNGCWPQARPGRILAARGCGISTVGRMRQIVNCPLGCRASTRRFFRRRDPLPVADATWRKRGGSEFSAESWLAGRQIANRRNGEAACAKGGLRKPAKSLMPRSKRLSGLSSLSGRRSESRLVSARLRG